MQNEFNTTNGTWYDEEQSFPVAPHHLPPEVRWFGIIVGSLTIVIGSIGNFLTILVIVRNRAMHTTFNRLLPIYV